MVVSLAHALGAWALAGAVAGRGLDAGYAGGVEHRKEQHKCRPDREEDLECPAAERIPHGPVLHDGVGDRNCDRDAECHTEKHRSFIWPVLDEPVADRHRQHVGRNQSRHAELVRWERHDRRDADAREAQDEAVGDPAVGFQLGHCETSQPFHIDPFGCQ